MVVSSLVTQDLGILWRALHKYKSYDNMSKSIIGTNDHIIDYDNLYGVLQNLKVELL
jgi:hypothetical protein